jgi:hypothetical protein
VVADENDDGVVGQAQLLKRVEDDAKVSVGLRY